MQQKTVLKNVPHMSVCIHWGAGHPVKFVLLLMTMTKSVDYAIHVNCIEDMQCILTIVIPIMKMSVTVTLEVLYVPIVTMVNMIN